IEHEGREAGARYRFRDDLAREWEEQARRFDHQEHRQHLVGYVAQGEETAVAQVDDEMRAIVGARRDVELERHFVNTFAGALDVEVELDVQLWLDLPGE